MSDSKTAKRVTFVNAFMQGIKVFGAKMRVNIKLSSAVFLMLSNDSFARKQQQPNTAILSVTQFVFIIERKACNGLFRSIECSKW